MSIYVSCVVPLTEAHWVTATEPSSANQLQWRACLEQRLCRLVEWLGGSAVSMCFRVCICQTKGGGAAVAVIVSCQLRVDTERWGRCAALAVWYTHKFVSSCACVSSHVHVFVRSCVALLLYVSAGCDWWLALPGARCRRSGLLLGRQRVSAVWLCGTRGRRRL